MNVSACVGLVSIVVLLSGCTPPLAMVAPATSVAPLPLEDEICPATKEDAVALFAKPSSDQPALGYRYADCMQPIARVYGLLNVGDATELSEIAAKTILRRLQDPAEIVRHEAIISARKHQLGMLPYLVSQLDQSSASAPAAAALLMTLNPAQGRDWLANDARWDNLLKTFSRQRWRKTSSDEGSIFAVDLAEREKAARSICSATEVDACFNEHPGGAYALLSINERTLVSDTATFQRALGAARGEVFPDDERDAELACELAGLCGGLAEQEADRESGDVADVETRGLMSMGQFLAKRNSRRISSTPGQAINALARFPRFPWPAPKPVLQEVIPSARFGGPGATLDSIAIHLRNILHEADPNFEATILSGPPDGFVLMARMERIQPDGKPYPRDNRFTYRGNPSLGFVDAVRGLVAERPGYFRVIAFVITSDLLIDEKRSAGSIPIHEIGGPSILPASLGNQKLGRRGVIALVYAFERRPGETQRPWTQGAPSALTHLRLSGMGSSLGF